MTILGSFDMWLRTWNYRWGHGFEWLISVSLLWWNVMLEARHYSYVIMSMNPTIAIRNPVWRRSIICLGFALRKTIHQMNLSFHIRTIKKQIPCTGSTIHQETLLTLNAERWWMQNLELFQNEILQNPKDASWWSFPKREGYSDFRNKKIPSHLK